VKASQPTVCMIAYTSYATDARVRREAETLAAHGFDVLCLTNRNGTRRERFVLDGVEVRELGVPKYRGKNPLAYLASYMRFLAASSIACARLQATRQVAVVHVHNIPDFLVFAGLLPRAFGAKVVLDIHDSVPETFAAKFSRGTLVDRALRLEERLSARVAHRVVCVNHPQRDALTARGIPAAKTFISMNVPDPRIFQRPLATRTPARDGTFNLVYHGTMAERLGVDLVIRAVADLGNSIQGLRLHLWGGGDDLAKFEMLAERLGIAGQVSFKPAGYPLHELPVRLSSMDVGVIGNRRSVATDLMLPVKLMEYAALGIPAIVPELRTIRRYFSADMVSFYEPDDVRSLAAAITRLYADETARRRQADAAYRFLDEHGWEKRGPELVTFYRTLLES
jgi:glycosyltransferase involved in cell wall biosynthesis